MKLLSSLIMLLAFVFPAMDSAGADKLRVVTDRSGGVQELLLNSETLATRTYLRIPTKGWAEMPGQHDAIDIEFSETSGVRRWTGTIPVGLDGKCRYQQTIRQTGRNQFSLRLTALAETDLNIEGIYLWMHLPIERFKEGHGRLTLPDGKERAAVLPEALPEKEHFLMGRADRVEIRDKKDSAVISMELKRTAEITIQDERQWNDPNYGLYVPAHEGPMLKGATAEFTATFTIELEADTRPALLSLDASTIRYRIRGIGGNYCFNTESPVTDYTLKHLRVGCARVEMNLRDWEPRNDNKDPAGANWKYYRDREKSGNEVGADMRMAARIEKLNIPYAISVWYVPEWLCVKPGQKGSTHGRRIPREKWPELAESITAYLIHLSKAHGAEPDWFSFNESDIGVMVKFTPEGHRDIIKYLGAVFRDHGLSTKLLLGDTASAGKLEFTKPAVSDQEALKHVGAVAFHSWGGAEQETYKKWAGLAKRLELPLYVTELGVDADWRIRPWTTPGYAMREAEMYQQILLYACPAGTMQWEFTGDYSILDASKKHGETTLEPTRRFYIVKHFCNLIPQGASALATESDHPKALFTGFRGKTRSKERVYTFHIWNNGAARKATVTGLPKELENRKLQAVRTGPEEMFQKTVPVTVRNSKIELKLRERSLLTLTTQPLE